MKDPLSMGGVLPELPREPLPDGMLRPLRFSQQDRLRSTDYDVNLLVLPVPFTAERREIDDHDPVRRPVEQEECLPDDRLDLRSEVGPQSLLDGLEDAAAPP
jgi:hypothetical protein